MALARLNVKKIGESTGLSNKAALRKIAILNGAVIPTEGKQATLRNEADIRSMMVVG